MCGIFGHIGQRPFDPKDMKLLALYNEDRGSDAVGVYNHETEKEFKNRTIKENVSVRRADIMRGDMNPSNLLIGHTRSKSIGFNNINNVHPFIGEDICGVHNGTIQNYEEIAEKYNVKPGKGESDSNVLYQVLAKTGGNFDVLGDIDGSATLAFTMNDGKLYLYRKDNHRPLYYTIFYMIESNIHHLMFSSTEESLRAIDVVPKGSIKSLETGKVLEFDTNTDQTGSYEIKDNKDKPKKTYSQSSSYSSSYKSTSERENTGSKTGFRSPSPVSRREITLSMLNYRKIGKESVKSCSVFKLNGGIEYTQFVLDSGALVVTKGDHHKYDPVSYGKEHAASVIDGLYCETRYIFYDLLLFDDGSFVEDRTRFNTGDSYKEVHERETTEEDGFGTEEEEEERSPNILISNIWAAYGNLIQNQQEFDKLAKNLESEVRSTQEFNINELYDQIKALKNNSQSICDNLTDLSDKFLESIKDEQ